LELIGSVSQKGANPDFTDENEPSKPNNDQKV